MYSITNNEILPIFDVKYNLDEKETILKENFEEYFSQGVETLKKQKYPKIYHLVDRDFPFYQDSYTKKMDNEIVHLLKEDAEYLKKIPGI